LQEFARIHLFIQEKLIAFILTLNVRSNEQSLDDPIYVCKSILR